MKSNKGYILLNKGTASNDAGYLFTQILFWILFVLWCGESWNWNYPAYLEYYNNYIYYYDSVEYEKLYAYLVITFNNLGFHFKYLYFFLYGIGLLLMRNVVNKYLGSNGWAFYILFFIYPTVTAVAAFRNTVAMFILIYAFPFLMSGKKWDGIKYAALIYIASLIHQSAIVYLLLLLVLFYDNKKIKKILLGFYFAALIVSIALLFIPSLLGNLQSFMQMFIEEGENEGLTKRMGYINDVGGLGFLVFGFFQVFCIYIVNEFRKLYQTYIGHGDVAERFAYLVLFADCLFLFSVVFVKMDSTFSRIFQSLIPLNQIVIILLYNRLRARGLGRRVQLLFTSFVIVFLAFAYFRGSYMFQYNIVPMFTNNWILSLDF